MLDGFQARVWILIERAEDIPRMWVSHCLDFDVVMQGQTIQEAFEEAKAGVTMVVVDDLARGADPRKRRAPPEYWDHLSKLLDHADRSASTGFPADESKVAAFAVEVMFSVLRVPIAALPHLGSPTQQAPIMEMAFTVPEMRVA